MNNSPLTETRTVCGIPTQRTFSIHERLPLPTPPELRQAEGHLHFASFPPEDLCTASPRPSHFQHLPFGYHRLLLTDQKDGDPAATFAINWDQGWHPQFFVKRASGRF